MRYTYYRAMPLLEANELIKNEIYINTKRNRGLTWWTETFADASRYANESRVIVRIVLDRPLTGRQVAEYINEVPHIEYSMTSYNFNKHLCNLIENIAII